MINRARHKEDFRVRAFHRRGPHVKPSTLAILDSWRETYGLSYGRQIDAMVEFCTFHPGFRLPLVGAREYLTETNTKENKT
jgi:hypothetical protein